MYLHLLSAVEELLVRCSLYFGCRLSSGWCYERLVVAYVAAAALVTLTLTQGISFLPSTDPWLR